MADKQLNKHELLEVRIVTETNLRPMDIYSSYANDLLSMIG